MRQREPLKTGFLVEESDGLPSDLPVKLRFPNGTLTRTESNVLDVNFTSQFLGIFAVAPASPGEGDTYINSGDNNYYIYYGGTWQVLHTLTPATLSIFLLETGTDALLKEDSDKLALQA
jgi:hypothetical protein